MSVNLGITGKDQLGPVVDKLVKKFGSLEDGLEAIGKESKKSAREAERLWRQSMTPAEKYNETLRKAKVLLDGTAEGQRKYASVVARANSKLKEQSSFFGDKQVTQLASYAAGWMGVSVAVRMTAEAFRDAKQLRDEYEAGQATDRTSAAQLAQVSGALGGMKNAGRLVNRLRMREGLSGTEASDLLFSLASAPGAVKETDFFGRLAGRGAVRDVGGLVTAGASLRSNYRNRNLSFENTTDILLSAAGGNPAKAQELGKAVGSAAQIASQAGISPEELAAATAILAESAQSPDVASTQVSAIASRMIELPQLQGKSILDVARMTSTMSAQEIAAMFPNIRAQKGIGTLAQGPQNLADFTGQVAADTGLSRRIAARPREIGWLEAQYQKNIAEQRRLVASERIGIESAQAEAAVLGVQADAASLGEGGLTTTLRQGGARWMSDKVRWLTDNPDIVEGAARFGAFGMTGLSTGLNRRAEDSMVRQLEQININTATGDLQTNEF